jgi:hypothetical protein
MHQFEFGPGKDGKTMPLPLTYFSVGRARMVCFRSLPELILMKTLKASLLASAIGTGAWMLGLTHKIWPAHPQWAVFFLTIGATAVLIYVLPESQK